MRLQSGKSSPSNRRPFIRLAIVLAGLPLLVAATYYIQALNNPNLLSPRWIRAELSPTYNWPEYHGFKAFEESVSLPMAFVRAGRRWAASLDPLDNGIPNLVVDVKFKHMRKIYEQRDLAVRKGQLVQDDDSFSKEQSA